MRYILAIIRMSIFLIFLISTNFFIRLQSQSAQVKQGQNDDSNNISTEISVLNQDTENYEGNDNKQDISDFQKFETDKTLNFNLRGDKKMFKPTNEWQEVTEDEMIPAGLHVRLNMANGKKEAKLLDHHPDKLSEKSSINTQDLDSVMSDTMKENIESALKEVIEKDAEETFLNSDEEVYRSNNLTFTKKELKEVLKKIKNPQNILNNANATPVISKKFRTMNELKQTFQDMKMDVKSDTEILIGLLDEYKQLNVSVEHKLDILADLEYFLHQIDNANNFVLMGGFELLMKDLNSSIVSVQKEAFLVLSSLSQNNPKVQIKAVENNAIQLCLLVLTSTNNYLMFEKDNQLQKRAISALAAILRNFPFAQKRFLELGGLNSLTAILKKDNLDEKIVVKIITLVNDLLLEPVNTKNDKELSEKIRSEKLAQYKKVNLLEAVINLDWCDLLLRFLDYPDHDTREKIMSIILTLKDNCTSTLTNYLTKFKELYKFYYELSVTKKNNKLAEDLNENLIENVAEVGYNTDDYFMELAQLVQQILNHIRKIIKLEEL